MCWDVRSVGPDGMWIGNSHKFPGVEFVARKLHEVKSSIGKHPQGCRIHMCDRCVDSVEYGGQWPALLEKRRSALLLSKGF